MRYAVAHMDFFNNDLKQVIVEADNPVAAMVEGAREILDGGKDTNEWLDSMLQNASQPDTVIEKIKQEFFDGDQVIAVTLVD